MKLGIGEVLGVVTIVAAAVAYGVKLQFDMFELEKKLELAMYKIEEMGPDEIKNLKEQNLFLAGKFPVLLYPETKCPDGYFALNQFVFKVDEKYRPFFETKDDGEAAFDVCYKIQL